MRFSRKVFLGIFCSSLLVGTVLIWAAHSLVTDRATEAYFSRYAVFSKVLGRTLVQLERNTEAMMLNAAEVVAREEAMRGLLSTEELRALAKKTSVTHVFIIDSDGKFIRSTNEDPKLIPNVFSFCAGYRSMVNGNPRTLLEWTPLITPAPEPNPYKFLFIPSKISKRIVEVGVRVDFLGKTFESALKDDPNLLAINLYAPNGATLGSFSRDEATFKRAKVLLPEKLDGMVDDGRQFRTFLKVDSGQSQCCQCDTAGISKNGEYYYVFESIISKQELTKTLAKLKSLFLSLQFIAFIVAGLVANLVSRKLSGRVQFVARAVRDMGRGQEAVHRIKLSGKDEVAYLAREFDGLLDRLDESRDEVIRAKKAEAVAEVASTVSHNIRSPLTSLETILTRLAPLSEQDRNIIRNAVKEIKDLVSRLKSPALKPDPTMGKAQSPIQLAKAKQKESVQLLSSLIEYAVSEKRLQFRGNSEIDIDAVLDGSSYGLFASVQPTEFRTILSNLINNSVEALGSRSGHVFVRAMKENGAVIVSVEDNGPGIPEDLLSRLGQKGVTFGKPGGSGIGLFDARTTIEAWGGKLFIASRITEGTTVSIQLPLAPAPEWFVPELVLPNPGTIVILDDDSSIHELWEFRFRKAGLNSETRIERFLSGERFAAWMKQRNAPESILYLVDYELLGEPRTGLDLIEEFRIASNSVLVTGRFDEELVLARVRWLGVKMIPKPLAGIVPVGTSEQSWKTGPKC